MDNHISSGEKYAFEYDAPAAIQSPFSPYESYGTATLLRTVKLTHTGQQQSFDYTGGSSGELTRVTFPDGGYIRYVYADFTFVDGRAYREVYQRYAAPAEGDTELYRVITHDAGDSGRTLHASTTLSNGTTFSKVYEFETSSASPYYGRALAYEERGLSPSVTKYRKDYTWTQTSAGNPYVGTVIETLDPGAAYEVQAKQTQALDTHGNLTEQVLYSFGELSTPARTYTMTYLTGAEYSSRNINNRLVSVVLAGDSQNLTLVENSYDEYGTTPTGCSSSIGLHSPGTLRLHDTTNYGTSFTWRGNLTRSVSNDVTACSVSATEPHLDAGVYF